MLSFAITLRSRQLNVIFMQRWFRNGCVQLERVLVLHAIIYYILCCRKRFSAIILNNNVKYYKQNLK